MKQIIAIFFLFSFSGFAQKINKDGPDFSIRGSACIPNPITSKMYGKSFDGVYEGNISLNLKVDNNFYIGLGYQSVMFQNDKNFKYTYYNASIPYNTKLFGNGIYTRLDYMRFFSATGYMSYALQAGYMASHYTNVNMDSSAANMPFAPTKFGAPFVQPEMSVNFIVENTLSFSIHLSYTTQFTHFDPKAPRFNQFEQISKLSNSYFMSWINFGFGFNVLINRKQKK